MRLDCSRPLLQGTELQYNINLDIIIIILSISTAGVNVTMMSTVVKPGLPRQRTYRSYAEMTGP